MSDESEDSSEKRKHRRFAVRQMIEMAFPRETFFTAEGLNLSEGGMYCRTDYPIEPYSKVYFMLNVPDGANDSVLRAEGTVIHTRSEDGGTVFGVSFSDFTPADKKAIRTYLDSMAEEDA